MVSPSYVVPTPLLHPDHQKFGTWPIFFGIESFHQENDPTNNDINPIIETNQNSVAKEKIEAEMDEFLSNFFEEKRIFSRQALSIPGKGRESAKREIF